LDVRIIGFLWPKGDVKNREEDLAKAKNQIEINEQNKTKHNNNPSDEHYE
jgi:hypothetical protein